MKKTLAQNKSRAFFVERDKRLIALAKKLTVRCLKSTARRIKQTSRATTLGIFAL